MSKIITLLLGLILFSNVLANEEEKHKQPQITETINGAHVYGQEWKSSESIIEIKTALTNASDYTDKELVFSGNIIKVCQKAGCWMILEQNGEFARVDFNNHAFFIPKDSQGKAEVFGKLSLKQMDKKQKQHLKADGAETLPEKVYEITATSVKILP